MNIYMADAMIYALYRSLPTCLNSEEKSRICEIARMTCQVCIHEKIEIDQENSDAIKKFIDDILLNISKEDLNQTYINDHLECFEDTKFRVNSSIDNPITFIVKTK